MAFKILTENSVDNTNIDGARAEHFNAGLRDGIVKGAFNEGTFTALASNVISLDTCELRISGHRIINDDIWTQPYWSIPTVAERRAVIAEIVVDDSSNVSFRIFDQLASVPLIKDNLFRTENGAGTYQVEIGRFTLTTNGTIADVKRTLDLITGGSSGMGEHFVAGDITTTMLDAGMNANVTAEDVYDANGNYKQTDFSFELPETAGTVVTVNDVEQENLNFTSDPQTQLNGKLNISDIDNALSSTSENPVQNKKVKEALDNKADASNVYTKTEIINVLLDKIYPINSIYMSVSDASPSTFLGGTWVQLKDRFLLGAGDIYSGGDTGGSSTHKHNLSNDGYAKITLTFSGQPRIMENKKGVSGYTINAQTTTTLNYEEGTFTSYEGASLGGSTDNTENLPPYLVVYMWKRTA